MSQCSEEAVCIGKASYIRINGNVRLRLEFSGSAAGSYDGITITMLNRKDGPIDTNVLKFKDIWGKKAVSNPNFKEGLVPHIWEYRDKTEWYVYQPNKKDYQILAEEISQYISMFQEAEVLQGPQINMCIQAIGKDLQNVKYLHRVWEKGFPVADTSGQPC